MSTKHSQAGFTLIEMMVVAAVVSVLAIGFASYMYQQTKLSSRAQGREGLTQMQINVLNSSGKSDVLLQSESLQVQNLGHAEFNCRAPCWVDPPGSENCIFRCGDPIHDPPPGHCPSSVDPPCVFDTHGH